MVAKLSALPTVEGDRIMYLGSDAYALSDAVTGIFEILERFDIAVAHAPEYASTGGRAGPEVPDVPNGIP